MPLNMGQGLRGSPGFHRAVVAAQGDDARGSALVVLLILSVTALGTAAVSPWIETGMVPLAALTFGLELAAVLCLARLPRLQPSTCADHPANA